MTQIDISCSKHEIDYRITCEECQEKYAMTSKMVIEQIEENRRFYKNEDENSNMSFEKSIALDDDIADIEHSEYKEEKQ